MYIIHLISLSKTTTGAFQVQIHKENMELVELSIPGTLGQKVEINDDKPTSVRQALCFLELAQQVGPAPRYASAGEPCESIDTYIIGVIRKWGILISECSCEDVRSNSCLISLVFCMVVFFYRWQW